MTRAAPPLAVAGFACAALVACHTGVGGHLSEPDKDKIRKVVEEATRVVTPPVSDVEAYVELYYAEDARLLPPSHATVTGREAIGAFLRSSGSFQAVRFTILALEGRNDLAYLVVTLAHNKAGICVDTHVHRITNRWGYVNTKTPHETEQALRAKLPKKHWIAINTILVMHVQNLCKPVSPFCSRCPVLEYCARTGVTKSR